MLTAQVSIYAFYSKGSVYTCHSRVKFMLLSQKLYTYRKEIIAFYFMLFRNLWNYISGLLIYYPD